MKKLLFLLLASFLVLAACGNEESKTEDKKEAKASDKESKKDDKKKDEDKSSDKEKDKSDDKSNEEVATEDETTEQPIQSQEQVNTQEQQPVQSQEQAPVVEKQPVQQEQPKKSDDGHTYHYDPEYDKYGYTGEVAEDGMPVLDPNENFDPHGGQVPNDNLTDEEIREMMGE